MAGDESVLRITASLTSQGAPVVVWEDEDGTVLLTPDQATRAATMLSNGAATALALSEAVAAHPGALAALISNPGGRA